jgi:hypothetical protein
MKLIVTCPIVLLLDPPKRVVRVVADVSPPRVIVPPPTVELSGKRAHRAALSGRRTRAPGQSLRANTRA